METLKKKKAFDELDKKFGTNASDSIIKVIDMVNLESTKELKRYMDEKFSGMNEKISGMNENFHKEISGMNQSFHKEISNLNKFRFTSLLNIVGIATTLLAALYGIYQFFQNFL